MIGLEISRQRQPIRFKVKRVECSSPTFSRFSVSQVAFTLIPHLLFVVGVYHCSLWSFMSIEMRLIFNHEYGTQCQGSMMPNALFISYFSQCHRHCLFFYPFVFVVLFRNRNFIRQYGGLENICKKLQESTSQQVRS